jgi:membrane-associated protein
MKYLSVLPLSALIALTLLQTAIHFEFLPPGLAILEHFKMSFAEAFYILIFLIILLESIVYVGFYFPGQFFAVVLVVGAEPQWQDILYLTIAMVLAATLGSTINYYIGKNCFSEEQRVKENTYSIKSLLIAMIHINSLAFFMLAQGAQHKSKVIIAYAGLLNLPYYLLLITGTAFLSEQVMGLAENTYFVFSALGVWLLISLVLDFRQHRKAE